MFDLVPASIGYIRDGKLRALAVTTAEPSAALPYLPTIGEFVPGYEASTWNGIVAPKNTPNDITDKLNRSINLALTDAGFVARLADLGAAPLPGTPAAFGQMLAEETAKWAKVIKFAGITAG
jgi:tripartite-type tricarboxylate transporter receptor subunit TctC